MISQIGKIDTVYLGYATDEAIRRNAASGGIITGALVGLLEANLIDGAIVNVPSPTKIGAGLSILARTKGEILESAKSIYCMTEISRGLSRIRHSDKNIAVVGLPCHMDELPTDPRIFVSFGLMCGKNVTQSFLLEVLWQQGINPEKVKKVLYRGVGWYPFSVRIIFVDDTFLDIPWISGFRSLWESGKFMSKHCKSCKDFAAEKADIACGDAWLKSLKGNQDGYSLVLTHTERGTGVIEMLREMKILTLDVVDASYIIESQELSIRRKKGL